MAAPVTHEGYLLLLEQPSCGASESEVPFGKLSSDSRPPAKSNWWERRPSEPSLTSSISHVSRPEWSRRWCVLRGNMLNVYMDRRIAANKPQEPCATICLDDFDRLTTSSSYGVSSAGPWELKLTAASSQTDSKALRSLVMPLSAWSDRGIAAPGASSQPSPTTTGALGMDLGPSSSWSKSRSKAAANTLLVSSSLDSSRMSPPAIHTKSKSSNEDKSTGAYNANTEEKAKGWAKFTVRSRRLHRLVTSSSSSSLADELRIKASSHGRDGSNDASSSLSSMSPSPTSFHAPLSSSASSSFSILPEEAVTLRALSANDLTRWAEAVSRHIQGRAGNLSARTSPETRDNSDTLSLREVLQESQVTRPQRRRGDSFSQVRPLQAIATSASELLERRRRRTSLEISPRNSRGSAVVDLPRPSTSSGASITSFGSRSPRPGSASGIREDFGAAARISAELCPVRRNSRRASSPLTIHTLLNANVHGQPAPDAVCSVERSPSFPVGLHPPSPAFSTTLSLFGRRTNPLMEPHRELASSPMEVLRGDTPELNGNALGITDVPPLSSPMSRSVSAMPAVGFGLGFDLGPGAVEGTELNKDNMETPGRLSGKLKQKAFGVGRLRALGGNRSSSTDAKRSSLYSIEQGNYPTSSSMESLVPSPKIMRRSPSFLSLAKVSFGSRTAEKSPGPAQDGRATSLTPDSDASESFSLISEGDVAGYDLSPKSAAGAAEAKVKNSSQLSVSNSMPLLCLPDGQSNKLPSSNGSSSSSSSRKSSRLATTAKQFGALALTSAKGLPGSLGSSPAEPSWLGSWPRAHSSLGKITARSLWQNDDLLLHANANVNARSGHPNDTPASAPAPAPAAPPPTVQRILPPEEMIAKMDKIGKLNAIAADEARWDLFNPSEADLHSTSNSRSIHAMKARKQGRGMTRPAPRPRTSPTTSTVPIFGASPSLHDTQAHAHVAVGGGLGMESHLESELDAIPPHLEEEEIDSTTESAGMRALSLSPSPLASASRTSRSERATLGIIQLGAPPARSLPAPPRPRLRPRVNKGPSTPERVRPKENEKEKGKEDSPTPTSTSFSSPILNRETAFPSPKKSYTFSASAAEGNRNRNRERESRRSVSISLAVLQRERESESESDGEPEHHRHQNQDQHQHEQSNVPGLLKFNTGATLIPSAPSTTSAPINKAPISPWLSSSRARSSTFSREIEVENSGSSASSAPVAHEGQAEDEAEAEAEAEEREGTEDDAHLALESEFEEAHTSLMDDLALFPRPIVTARA